MSRALWAEVLLLTLLAALLAASVSLSAGEWSWSWDGLNHHIYLGLTAEQPRWHLDVTAASVQSYQYPYLYWPVYRISLMPISGAQAGAIWGAVQAAVVLPPVWLASRNLLPAEGTAAQAVFERVAACVLAGSSIVVMAAVGTTSNDLMAAVPLVWAVALMTAPKAGAGRACTAAALWGVGTAFKWSNGLAIPLLLFWWWRSERPHFSVQRGVQMAVAAAAGFALAYAPWGWQLWRQTGNPFYPFFAAWFGG